MGSASPTAADMLAAVKRARSLQALQSVPNYAVSGASTGQGGAYLATFLNSAQSRASSLMAKATQLFSKYSCYLGCIINI
jgi:hypothetical protein